MIVPAQFLVLTANLTGRKLARCAGGRSIFWQRASVLNQKRIQQTPGLRQFMQVNTNLPNFVCEGFYHGLGGHITGGPRRKRAAPQRAHA